MATVFDSPFVRQRLQRLRQRDVDVDEELSFARCDCTSYSYFALSMMLFSIGTIVTVLACGDTDGFILNYFGHMWLVGPIFICSGLMIAVKSMLYLRRKSVIQMLLHQRAIFRELAAQQAELQAAGCILRSSSSATLPPAYEALVPLPISPSPGGEAPPPTYEEAMCLLLSGTGDTSNNSQQNKSTTVDIQHQHQLQQQPTGKLTTIENNNVIMTTTSTTTTTNNNNTSIVDPTSASVTTTVPPSTATIVRVISEIQNLTDTSKP